MNLLTTRGFTVIALRASRWAILLLALVLFLGAPLSGQDGQTRLDTDTNKLFEQPNEFPECLGPDNPFCPSGFPSDGGGDGGGSFNCQYCDAVMEGGQMLFRCTDVDYGEEGWTECNDNSEGTSCGIGGVGCGKV